VGKNALAQRGPARRLAVERRRLRRNAHVQQGSTIKAMACRNVDARRRLVEVPGVDAGPSILRSNVNSAHRNHALHNDEESKLRALGESRRGTTALSELASAIHAKRSFEGSRNLDVKTASARRDCASVLALASVWRSHIFIAKAYRFGGRNLLASRISGRSVSAFLASSRSMP
jgi:hypothetical protein